MEMQQLVSQPAPVRQGVSAALYAVRMGFPPLVIHNGYGALEKGRKNRKLLRASVSCFRKKELYENGLSQCLTLNVPVLKDELLSITYDGEYTIQASEGSYHTQRLFWQQGQKEIPFP